MCAKHKVPSIYPCITYSDRKPCCSCTRSFLNHLQYDLEFAVDAAKNGLKLDGYYVGVALLLERWDFDLIAIEFLEKFMGPPLFPRRVFNIEYHSYVNEPPSLLELTRWKVRDQCANLPLPYNSELPKQIVDYVNFKDL